VTFSDGCLPSDGSVSRPGGASGDDPRSEGSPRQDLLAALAFLDAVDGKVAAAERERFEQLRDQVRSADGGQGCQRRCSTATSCTPRIT